MWGGALEARARRHTSAVGEAPVRALIQAADEAEAHLRRMWRLGRMEACDLDRLLSGDPAEAAPWIESAARYGLVEAQLRLGQMRLDGVGVARDEAAALAWFRRAADQGSPEAMNMVGRCYENGWGAPESLTVAAHWYRRSAEAGHDWGEYNYANLLFDGRGLEQDATAAVLWYRRAAEQRHARAMNLLARCYEEGWGVARDAPLAFGWYRRSAEAGYFRAQYNYATLLVARGEDAGARAWFARALEGAPPDSRGAMLEGLARQGGWLVELARRHAEDAR